MTNKVSKLVFFQALRHNDINIIHRSRYSSKIPTIITILNIIIVVVIIVIFWRHHHPHCCHGHNHRYHCHRRHYHRRPRRRDHAAANHYHDYVQEYTKYQTATRLAASTFITYVRVPRSFCDITIFSTVKANCPSFEESEMTTREHSSNGGSEETIPSTYQQKKNRIETTLHK